MVSIGEKEGKGMDKRLYCVYRVSFLKLSVVYHSAYENILCGFVGMPEMLPQDTILKAGGGESVLFL